MNEFGTLEMVSTVETEKGEYEWSTATTGNPYFIYTYSVVHSFLL